MKLIRCKMVLISRDINPALTLPPYYRKIHFVKLLSHLHVRAERYPPCRLPKQNFVYMYVCLIFVTWNIPRLSHTHWLNISARGTDLTIHNSRHQHCEPQPWSETKTLAIRHSDSGDYGEYIRLVRETLCFGRQAPVSVHPALSVFKVEE
jgi:hypothetical protein